MPSDRPPPSGGPDPRRGWTWYHVTLTTYGAWLPGDARGFRTRHHRDHVDGDYKNPPAPGAYRGLEAHVRKTLKQPPVNLSPSHQALVGKALLERLDGAGAIVVCVAVASQHVHLLAKMPRAARRDWLGAAKRHAWFELRDHGWKGKLWAKGGRMAPVLDREYQLNVYRYIIRHAESGAWVWKWGDAKG
jgi:hypothetical protein